MKKIVLFMSVMVSLLTACTSFDEASKAEDISALNVGVNLTVDVENLASVKDLKVKFDNYADGYHYETYMIGFRQRE